MQVFIILETIESEVLHNHNIQYTHICVHIPGFHPIDNFSIVLLVLEGEPLYLRKVASL